MVRRIVAIGIGITGLCLAVLPPIINLIVRSKISEKLQLKQGSEAWERWENLPVPIQYRIYVFNVNNPDEIARGELPSVTEIGPYVYREKRTKTILSVDEKTSSVVYQQKLHFEFDQEASQNLTEDDVITVVNIPALLFAQIVDDLKDISFVIPLFNSALEKMWPTNDSKPLFVKVKVKDYLFKGTPIICNQEVKAENVDVKIMCEALRTVHPKTISVDDPQKNIHSFSFFKYKNDSHDGTYEIDLGINDITKIGQIKSWNNVSLLSNWKTEKCNRILGSDATVFRPYLKDDNVESLHIFHTDICRSMKLVYEKDVEYKGVPGRRYVLDENTFSSVLDYNDNFCYCPQSVKGITYYAGCLKSGVLELSSCHRAPVIISYPHLLMADPAYQNQVKGLNPDKSIHRIFLDLEPNTGYPLRAASRMQVNAFLKSIHTVDAMRNLPNVLIPTVWLEESVELTDELIEIINSQLLSILPIVRIVGWVALGIGISMILLSLYFLISPCCRSKMSDKKK